MPAPGSNRPIIVKKIIQEEHGGHHGGAWKVAYADFVTAMMAFFLLMWLLGATTEKQRKALADYFAPTIVDKKQASAGSNGLLGGDSITSADNYPNRQGQTGTRAITIPKDATGGPKESDSRSADAARFQQLRQTLKDQIERNRLLKRYARSIRLTETQEGLRVDLVDEANFSMFIVGTNVLTGEAQLLLNALASAINELPNEIKIRGHTDAAQFSQRRDMNNWMLSSARAEATRVYLATRQVDPNRFIRIEGVADREPYDSKNPYAPANRRISVTLGWTTPRYAGKKVQSELASGS
jgi:chemotaxis protein MotB